MKAVGNCLRILCLMLCVFLLASCDTAVDVRGGKDDLVFELTEQGGEKYYVITGCSNKKITTVDIPTSVDGIPVTRIGDCAFDGCTELKSISVPEGITHIGTLAFRGCSSLTSADLPDSTESIGNYVFYGCPVENLNVSSGNRMYRSSGNCIIGNLTNTLVIGCKNSVIPADGSVERLGAYSFWRCDGLTSLSIPAGITSIESGAIYGCTDLESITVSPDNERYHSAGNCVIETAMNTLIVGCKNSVIPDDGSIVAIEGLAFGGCNTLKSVYVPDSVVRIDAFAFFACSGLESLTVADGNERYYSDGNCIIDTKTKAVVLGCKNSVLPTDGSITGIEQYAFGGCTALTGITVPASVTKISPMAFSGCNGLESLVVADGNEKYHSAGNCVIETEAKKLAAACKTSVIPADGSVTAIGESVFNRFSVLTDITIPDGVTTIGDYAFRDCYSLTGVTLPSSITEIGAYAFYGCDALKEITFCGTKEQWDAVNKRDFDDHKVTVHCTE